MARVKYTPNRGGMRELARSAGVQGAAVSAARAVAAEASRIDPGGGYEARPATVTAGWDNESRAGAEVVETQRGNGARTRALARAAQSARVT